MKRILVTQSDRKATEEVASVLMEQGFEVEDAHDIEEALQKAAKGQKRALGSDHPGHQRVRNRVFRGLQGRSGAHDKPSGHPLGVRAGRIHRQRAKRWRRRLSGQTHQCQGFSGPCLCYIETC